MRLENLPTETLLEIISQLPSAIDVKHLSIVSFRLRAPAQKVLFTGGIVSIPRSRSYRVRDRIINWLLRHRLQSDSTRKPLFKSGAALFDYPNHLLEQSNTLAFSEADLLQYSERMKNASCGRQLVEFALALIRNPELFSGITRLEIDSSWEPGQWNPDRWWIPACTGTEYTDPSPSSQHIDDNNIPNKNDDERTLLQAGQLHGIHPELFDTQRASYALVAILHRLPRLQYLVVDGAELPLPTVTLAGRGKLSDGVPPGLLSLKLLELCARNQEDDPPTFCAQRTTSVTYIVTLNPSSAHIRDHPWMEGS